MKAKAESKKSTKSKGHTVTNEMRKKYGLNMAKVINQRGK